MSANIQHSSGSVEAYTPPEVVEAGRATMGGIDLDPFSCREANKVVRATEYFHKGGFHKDWHGRCFVNPPGGTLVRDTLLPSIRPDGKPGNGYSSQAVGWACTLHQYLIGNVEQAIFVCFTLNTFQNSNAIPGLKFLPYQFPFCVPRKRLRFWSKSRAIGKGTPSQPNAVIYLGDNVDKFVAEFSKIGVVRV